MKGDTSGIGEPSKPAPPGDSIHFIQDDDRARCKVLHRVEPVMLQPHVQVFLMFTWEPWLFEKSSYSAEWLN